MHYTKGPWKIIPTVYSTRKNIFCVAEHEECHVATLISSSQERLQQFKANAAVISLAPEMYDLIQKVSKLNGDSEQLEVLEGAAQELIRKLEK